MQLRYRPDLPLVLKGASCRIRAQGKKLESAADRLRSTTLDATQTAGAERVESGSSKEKLV